MNGPRKRLQTLTLLAIPLILVLAARGFAQDKPEDPAETPATPPAATGGNQVPPAKDDSADPAFDPPFAGGLGSGFGPGGVFGFGTPRLVQGGDIMISWSKNNDELRGFSQKTGEWTYLKIEKQATIAPTVASDVAAARVGDAMAAYSGATGTWDVLQLSKGSKAVASVSSTSIKVVDNDHLYIFAAANGKWTSPDDPNFRRPTRSDPLVPPSAVPRRASEMQNIPFDQQALKLARELRGKGLHDEIGRAHV